MKLKILIKRMEVWKEYESSANEQNSLNNPHENINLYYYLKLLLFRIAKNIGYMVFFLVNLNKIVANNNI